MPSTAGVPTYTDWSQYTNQNQNAVNQQDAAVTAGLTQDAKVTPMDPGSDPNTGDTNVADPNAKSYVADPASKSGFGFDPGLSDAQEKHNAQVNEANTVATGNAPAPAAFQAEWGLLSTPEGFQQLATKYGAGSGSVSGSMFDAGVNPGGTSVVDKNPTDTSAQFWGAANGAGGTLDTPDIAPTSGQTPTPVPNGHNTWPGEQAGEFPTPAVPATVKNPKKPKQEP